MIVGMKQQDREVRAYGQVVLSNSCARGPDTCTERNEEATQRHSGTKSTYGKTLERHYNNVKTTIHRGL